MHYPGYIIICLLTCKFLYVLFCILSGFNATLIGYDLLVGIKQKKLKRILYKFLLEIYPIVSCIILIYYKHDALRFVLFGYVIIFVIQEMIQFSLSPIIYLTTWGNYLDTFTLYCTLLILSDENGKVFTFILEPQSKLLATRVLASFIMISEWGKFTAVLVKHPLMSKLFQAHLYIPIFFKVMQTFLFFIIAYGQFLFTYALGFFIIFHDGDVDEKGGENIFRTFWLSLVKTSTMTTGELNFDELPIDQNRNGILPFLFFASFLVIIVVVLMNLLNALIIGDIGEMLKNADIIHIRTKINTILYLERMLNVSVMGFGVLDRIKKKLQNNDIFIFNDHSNTQCGLWHLQYDRLPSQDIVTAIKEIVAQRTIKENEEEKLRENLTLEKIQYQLDLLQNLIKNKKSSF